MKAVKYDGVHALVLAGAGTGKTSTIIARTAWLIQSGVPADRIQLLTFTRSAAQEIVTRVKATLGNKAEGLNAGTFHAWCMHLIHSNPKLFGCVGHSVIDRDDQLQLFKLFRGKDRGNPIPSAASLCDIYSMARNTRCNLTESITKKNEDFLKFKEQIATVIKSYEARKRDRKFLDYDDILDVVATVFKRDSEVCKYISSHYDHILVDEMQDTNPLQWELLEPLSNTTKLFCVGDDAQSIYGFRGADFKNVHNFKERLPNSEVLKLERNYRSTQEILDLSNWLLAKSPIKYDKELVSHRGNGIKPSLYDFRTEWDEARWITDDLSKRYADGAPWNHHMILSRSSFSARAMETTLLARSIPYKYIGGTKLLQTAHIKDILSLLRVIANPLDDMSWMRYLTLWNGIGDSKANAIIEQMPTDTDTSKFIELISSQDILPDESKEAYKQSFTLQNEPAKAYEIAKHFLLPTLEQNYLKDWDKRKGDFKLIDKLITKHSSISEFIEEYMLDPVGPSRLLPSGIDDAVTLITVHSAKGTEAEVCYVLNVSPGYSPPQRSLYNVDEVEEERRVLYVALTRAKNELIITRLNHQIRTLASTVPSISKATEEHPEYKKLNANIKRLSSELAFQEIKLNDYIEDKNDAEIIYTELQIANLKKEIHTISKEIKKIIDETSEESELYFLNDMPEGLVENFIPEDKDMFWNQKSLLTERERPELGIDLS